MKKRIRQISKYKVWIVMFAYVFCCFSTIEIYGQKTKTVQKPTEEWFLSFEVTIKGTGEKKSSNNVKIEQWRIDRTYSGVIELNLSIPTPIGVTKGMTPNEMMARVNAAPMMWLHEGKDQAHSLMMIKVKIHDSKFLLLNEKGEGNTFEKTQNVIYWDGEGTALADSTVQLILDKNNSLYNVTIPLELHLNDQLLKKVTKHTIDRSDHGYGDAPTHEDTPIAPEDVALGTLAFPKVIGLLVGGKIHHPQNLPFKLVNGSFEWDSGDLDLDEPIFKDIPSSKNGIKVHIYYLLKKMTAK